MIVDPASDNWLDILADMFMKRVSKIKIVHNNEKVIANEDNLKTFNDVSN